MTIFLAIVLGFLFGFILQKTGASNPQKIIDMLRLRDLHLMKAILLGIGSSSIVLFGLISVGIIDAGHLSVKSSYVGVIVGGLILGLGWALAGFCPGTGVVALGAGRKDSIFFILGGLVGAFIYMLSYASMKSSFLFDSLGGKVTIVDSGNEKYNYLVSAYPALIIVAAISFVLILVAVLLPKSILKSPASKTNH